MALCDNNPYPLKSLALVLNSKDWPRGMWGPHPQSPPSIQDTSWARPWSSHPSEAVWGLPEASWCWARSWGCTGRTDFPGSASWWSPASESPRWSSPPPDSRTALWGHTCGKLPSGCGKQKDHQINTGVCQVFIPAPACKPALSVVD